MPTPVTESPQVRTTIPTTAGLEQAARNAEAGVRRFIGLPHLTTRGSTINALQRALVIIGARPTLEADSIYGPRTEAAAHRLLDHPPPSLKPGDGFNSRPQNRAAIERLQRALNALGGSAALDLDGRFGERTQAALVAWQQSLGANNPSPEGEVNAATWQALLAALVEKLDAGDAPVTASRRSDLDATRTAGGALDAPTSAGAAAGLPPATVNFDPQQALGTLLPQLTAVASPSEQVGLSDALQRYVTAYANFTRSNPGAVQGRYGMLVNFGARSDQNGRAFIMDMQNLRLMRGPMPVAHGAGRGQVPHSITGASLRASYGDAASPFSNTEGSNKSSLGVFTTFPLSGNHNGRFGGRPYSRPRVGLKGRSLGFNDQARSRGVYMHGIPWVGRTQGCPGFLDTVRMTADDTRESDTDAMIRLLERQASFVFMDAPVSSWHQNDPWLATE